MKLDTNLYTGKQPPSLEEGPMRYQQPDAIFVKRVEARSHCQRCIQVLKVILYLELILFVGWIGCVSLSSYYQAPKYSDAVSRDESPVWADDSSDGVPSTDSSSAASNDPPRSMPPWLLDYGTMTGYEPIRHPPEVIPDNNDDLIEIEKSANPTSDDETEISDIDVPLSKWLNTMTITKMSNPERLWDDFSSKDSDSDEEKVTESEDSGQEEPFESFNERWKKIMANIDEDSDEFNASKDLFDSTPIFTPRFPNNPDDISDEDSLEKMLDSLIDSFGKIPYHPILFSDSDVSDSAWDYFKRDAMLFNDKSSELNDKSLSRNVREIGTDGDSDSDSSSDETTTQAPKVKRSAESSSEESGENDDKSVSSDSASSEENVEKIVRKIPSKCPKILDDNGTPIEDPEKIVEHIKKNWFKSLLETTIPNCGGPNAPKNVTLDECGKFVIVCALPKIENEQSQSNGMTPEDQPEVVKMYNNK